MIEEVLRFNAAEAPVKMGTFSQYDHPHTLSRYAEIADYLGIKGGTATVHWRFVDFHRVPGGPWARYGKDNPFINPELKRAIFKYQHKHNIITTKR